MNFYHTQIKQLVRNGHSLSDVQNVFKKDLENSRAITFEEIVAFYTLSYMELQIDIVRMRHAVQGFYLSAESEIELRENYDRGFSTINFDGMTTNELDDFRALCRVYKTVSI